MAPPAAATAKMAKPVKSKIVTFKLAPAHLSNFPHTPNPSAKSSSKSSASSPDTPIPRVNEPTPTPDLPLDPAATPAAANGTSTPSSSLAPPAAGTKRKAPSGPRPGAKRGASHLTPDSANGLPKQRGKPGPKKKQKLGDMINDPNSKGPFAAPAPIQKLGPKANQGAINAGLRALDRTGKPCRKWEKKGFQVRSFTGVNWSVPTWRAPKNAAVFAEDVKSDTTASVDTKVKDESSAISDKSGLPTGSVPPVVNGIASSPAPVAAPS